MCDSVIRRNRSQRDVTRQPVRRKLPNAGDALASHRIAEEQSPIRADYGFRQHPPGEAYSRLKLLPLLLPETFGSILSGIRDDPRSAGNRVDAGSVPMRQVRVVARLLALDHVWRVGLPPQAHIERERRIDAPVFL